MAVYEPRIDQTLADDYQNRWSIDLIYENRRAADGWAAYVNARIPLYNDVEIWWEPDMNDEIRLHQAVLSHIGNYNRGRDEGLWTLSEAGWLDENWFGVNHWSRIYSKDGRWWGGVRLSLARDRDPMSFAGLPSGRIGYGIWWYYDDDVNPWRTSAWVQGGFSLPDAGLDFELAYGRFLDEDMGAKLSVTRRWDDTAVGFWVSRTDLLAPGKDFTNAGVHLELPAEKWFGTWFGASSSHIWEQNTSFLSIWEMESAREPGAWRGPDRTLSQLRPAELRRNVESLFVDYCSHDETESDKAMILGLTDFIN
jgi:hypothetical protein